MSEPAETDPPKKKRKKKRRSGDTAVLLRSGDPMRVRQLVELLADHGIETMTPGLEHRSMLQVLGGYVDIVVRVPIEDLERARGLLRSLDEAEPVDPIDDDAEDDAEPETAEPARVANEKATYRSAASEVALEPIPEHVGPTTPRSKLIAAFLALIIPGGAHMYCWRYAHGAVLLLLQIVVLFALGRGVPFALATLAVVPALDVAGAWLWCDVSHGRARPVGPRRLAAPLAIVLVFATLFVEVGVVPRWMLPIGTSGWCSWVGHCGQQSEWQCLVAATHVRPSSWVRHIPAACGTCLAEQNCDGADRCDEVCAGAFEE